MIEPGAEVMFMSEGMGDVILSMIEERQRQHAKWGEQNHDPVVWLAILGEEVGELCQAVLETRFDNGPKERAKGGHKNMRAEAVQVMAVAEAFIEHLDRLEAATFKLENVKVFQVNDYDGVAAESVEEAKACYLKETGLDEEEAFEGYDAKEIPLDHKIFEDESGTNKQSLKQALAEGWTGKPYIIFSSEC